ncbi:cation:dicarboxylase symporter family transporter, partial [Arthrobacter deserti]|nr:cation:dicarboxylase symporter family transporter [Arthrobacter deserti]
MASSASEASPLQVPPAQQKRRKDRTHFLYIAVIAAVVLGAVLGLAAPEAGQALKPLGTGFIALIKMMIAPIIFC